MPLPNPPRWVPQVDWRGMLSELRCRYAPNAIHAHHGERPVALRFPTGVSWRRMGGVRWCPVCASIHPLDLMLWISGRTLWSPAQSQAEMQELIDKGEMEPSPENMMRSVTPLPDQVYSAYEIGPFGMPVAMTFKTFDLGTVSFLIAHLADLSHAERALVVSEMNVWNHSLFVSISMDDGLHFSHTGIALVVPSGDDDDDDLDGDPGC